MKIDIKESDLVIAERLIGMWDSDGQYGPFESEVEFYFEILEESGMDPQRAAEVISEIDVDYGPLEP